MPPPDGWLRQSLALLSVAQLGPVVLTDYKSAIAQAQSEWQAAVDFRSTRTCPKPGWSTRGARWKQRLRLRASGSILRLSSHRASSASPSLIRRFSARP